VTPEDILAQDNLLWTEEGRKRILIMLAKAIDAERVRCSAIVMAARMHEIDTDFRSILGRIDRGDVFPEPAEGSEG
jgi:hypothetical protein